METNILINYQDHTKNSLLMDLCLNNILLFVLLFQFVYFYRFYLEYIQVRISSFLILPNYLYILALHFEMPNNPKDCLIFSLLFKMHFDASKL